MFRRNQILSFVGLLASLYLAYRLARPPLSAHQWADNEIELGQFKPGRTLRNTETDSLFSHGN